MLGKTGLRSYVESNFEGKDGNKSHDLKVIYDFLQTEKTEKLFKEKKAKLKSKYFYII